MSSDIYYTVEDGEVPPSYFESISPSPTYTLSPSSSSISRGNNELVLPPSSSITSPLTTHLHNLPMRMRANQEARVTEQAAQDAEIIALLAPHVEKFMVDLGSLARIPTRAELTLVPGTMVPKGAKMSGAAERRREGEVVRVVRVEFPRLKKDDSGDKKGGEKYGNGYPSEKGMRDNSRADNGDGVFDDSDEDERDESGFDEWGRFDTEAGEGATKENPWFFRDEAMAHRLARYLGPEPNLDRRHIQAVVAGGGSPAPVSPGAATSSSSSGWSRWGRKKQQAVPKSVNSPMLSPGETEQASMTVRVEEVVFRVVNDFGIYESLSGFGIVVTVKIRG
ncbi:hypothetical protein QBC37DRAFT_274775 [Rhypophila decipiens]|uniref:Uncharacterized protein n=1 Tax=Rhypophila decipiens TaxID=261697 RepID=A0AAN7BCI5_9PEZI|nr:hypothetical protein QBC37DRAFT_274775 [Rhypophila decipiens]